MSAGGGIRDGPDQVARSRRDLSPKGLEMAFLVLGISASCCEAIMGRFTVKPVPSTDSSSAAASRREGESLRPCLSMRQTGRGGRETQRPNGVSGLGGGRRQQEGWRRAVFVDSLASSVRGHRISAGSVILNYGLRGAGLFTIRRQRSPTSRHIESRQIRSQRTSPKPVAPKYPFASSLPRGVASASVEPCHVSGHQNAASGA